MKPWRITWDGRSWGESDLTVRHAVIAAAALGRDTWDLAPAGPVRLSTLVAALVAVDGGRPFDDVIAEVMARPLGDLVDALTFED